MDEKAFAATHAEYLAAEGGDGFTPLRKAITAYEQARERVAVPTREQVANQCRWAYEHTDTSPGSSDYRWDTVADYVLSLLTPLHQTVAALQDRKLWAEASERETSRFANDLRDRLETAEKRAANLERELDQWKETAAAANRAMCEARSIAAELEQDRDNWRDQYQDGAKTLRGRIAELERERDTAVRHEANLREALNAERASNADQFARIGELERELAETRQALQAETQLLVDWQVACVKARRERDALLAVLRSVIAQLDAAEHVGAADKERGE